MIRPGHLTLLGMPLALCMASGTLAQDDLGVRLNPDLDRDGTVGTLELSAILAGWGPAGTDPRQQLLDIDSDGVVGVDDLDAVLAAWGDGPSWPEFGARGLRVRDPMQVETVDIDRDGRVDLLVRTDNLLRIFWNLGPDPMGFGDGSPRFDLWSAPLPAPTRFVVTDLEGDGAPEIVAVTSDLAQVVAYRWTGIGFSAELLFAVSPAPLDLVAGDFDGDGDRDIATRPPSSSLVRVYDNVSEGFVLGASLTVGQGTASLLAGDVDGDESDDLVVFIGAVDNEHFIVHRAADRRSSEWPGVTYDALMDTVSGVALGDLDGSGTDDIVLSGRYSYPDFTARVFLSDAEGGFGGPSPTIANRPMRQMRILDVDGDGLRDIVGLRGFSPPSRGVSVLRQTAPMQFAPIVESPGASDTSSIAVADLRGSGELDAVVASKFNDALYLHDIATLEPGESLAMHIPSFDPDRSWTSPPGGSTPIVVVRSGPTKLSVIRFVDGASQAPETVLLPDPIRGVAVSDINEDGIDDLLVIHRSALYARLGQAEGSFGEWNSTAVEGDSVNDLIATDFNADGHLDAVWIDGDPSAWWIGRVWVALGAGDGTFSAPVQVASPPAASRLEAGDIDADGDLDLVLAADPLTLSGGADIIVLRQSAPMKFEEELIVAIGYKPAHSLRVADVDGDGDSDVVAAFGAFAYFQPRHFAVIRFDPSTPPTIDILTSVYVNDSGDFTDVRVGDLNGDGLPELVACASYSSSGGAMAEIRWNVGGTFSPSEVVPDDRTGRSMQLLDVDGDGDLDIFTVSTGWTIFDLSANFNVRRDASAPRTR